jgi:hypothetical protein
MLLSLLRTTSTCIGRPASLHFFAVPITRTMVTVHQVAQTGFGAGTNELYDR